MESGIVDNAEKYFDDYILWAEEKNDEGETTDEYALDTHNVFYAGEKNKDGKTILEVTSLSSNQIELEEGENMLGFHVEAFKTWKNSKGEEESGYRWNGFDWVNVMYEEEEDSTTTTTITDMTFPAHYTGTVKFTAEYTASWGETLNCAVEGTGQLTITNYSTPIGEGEYDYYATSYSDVATAAKFDEEDDTKNTCEVWDYKDPFPPKAEWGTHDMEKREFVFTYEFRYHNSTNPPCASDTLHGTHGDKTAEFEGTLECDIPQRNYYAVVGVSFTGSRTDDPPLYELME